MPFIKLQDGSEILLDLDDIPKPPASLYYDNPYRPTDPLFIRWQVLAKARYVKAMYKAAKDAEDKKHFLELVGDAKSVLRDPTAWNEYLSCRGLDESKRKPGRPKMRPEDRKNPKGRIRRSDQMRALLLEHGIAIKSIGQDEYLVEYPDWEFLPNGRLRYQKSQPISVHRFLQDLDLIPM